MCSLEKVLTEARQLANRMRSHDQSLESMIQKAADVQNRLEVMRQYQEATLALSELAKHARPRSHLILNIAAENKQLAQLKAENRDLRTALDEHQAALELIMSKYREQMTKLMESCALLGAGGESQSPSSSEAAAEPHNGALVSADVANRQQATIQRLLDRVHELSLKLRDSNNEGESVALEMEGLIQQLITENEGLRGLLAINQGKRAKTTLQFSSGLAEEARAVLEGFGGGGGGGGGAEHSRRLRAFDRRAPREDEGEGVGEGTP